MKYFVAAFMLWSSSLIASSEDPCFFIQSKALSWVETDITITSDYPGSLIGFVFSKPKLQPPSEQSLATIMTTGYDQGYGMACKMKRNSSVAKFLDLDLEELPADDCVALNIAYLEELEIDTDRFVFEVKDLTSGPEWVNEEIDYEQSEDMTTIKLPVLLTDSADEGSDGRFQGMHYCKVVSLDKL